MTTFREATIADAAEIARLMLEICERCNADPVIGDLICRAYPFGQSLDEVAHAVIAWRSAMVAP